MMVHAVLIVFVLFVSALAGRQFFMDGTNFIVQSFLDPFWYPGAGCGTFCQPCDNRFEFVKKRLPRSREPLYTQ